MEDAATFALGRPADDHLRLTVLRRFAESPDEWFDYGSLESRIEIRAGGMRADFIGTFRAEGFAKLRDDLADLDRAFRPGVVRFEPGYEEGLTFALDVRRVGRIEISGVAVDGLGTGNEQRLVFAFGVEDSLRELLASAASVVDSFPPSPQTRFTGVANEMRVQRPIGK